MQNAAIQFYNLIYLNSFCNLPLVVPKMGDVFKRKRPMTFPKLQNPKIFMSSNDFTTLFSQNGMWPFPLELAIVSHVLENCGVNWDLFGRMVFGMTGYVIIQWGRIGPVSGQKYRALEWLRRENKALASMPILFCEINIIEEHEVWTVENCLRKKRLDLLLCMEYLSKVLSETDSYISIVAGGYFLRSILPK